MQHRKAFVTGGTGFIGSHLVRALLDDGWRVATGGRRARPDGLAAEVDYHRVDLAEDDLAPALAGTSHVFHLAGLSSSIATEEEMYRANVDGTRRLAEAARQAGVQRFVHLSTTSVYGKQVQLPQPVPEDAEPHPGPGYAESKWLGEQALREVADRDGLAATVLRPVTVYGPCAIKLVASTILDAAIEAYAGLSSFQIPPEGVELRLVHVDDVVGALLHLAAAEQAVGRAFNLASGRYPSSHEAAALVAGEFGLELELTDDTPRGLDYERRAKVREQMLAEGMREGILLKDKRIRLLKKANPNNRVSLEALAATGFEPQVTDITEAIPANVAWYREHGWIL